MAETIVAKRWKLALHDDSGGSIVTLEFHDEPIVNEILAREHAVELAKAIMLQYENPQGRPKLGK